MHDDVTMVTPICIASAVTLSAVNSAWHEGTRALVAGSATDRGIAQPDGLAAPATEPVEGDRIADYVHRRGCAVGSAASSRS